MLSLRSILPLLIILSACVAPSNAPTQSPPAVRRHSEQIFQKLQHEEQQSTHREEVEENRTETSSSPPRSALQAHSTEEFLIATGHGDLTKGHLICQRVSDTAARMELAKQIRVLVKEHATDRVREQTGKPFEQDIEIVREEMTNELLQNVRFVDHSVDEATHTCSSTAIMPKSHIIPKRQDAKDEKPSTP